MSIGHAASTKYESIIVARTEHTLEITLHRPDRMNAINETMAGELIDILKEAEADRSIGAILVLGNERSFCAGADLGKFNDDPKDRFDNYRAGYNLRTDRLLYQRLHNYTKPVISAVEGFCLGAGLEIALLGDFIVAGEEAQFGFPEVRHGLMPGAGGTQNLLRVVGKAMAKELMWTGRRLSAAEAKDLRIVNHVVASGSAASKAREIIGSMLENAPLSIMMIKQAVNRGADIPLTLALRQEADLAYLLAFSEDRAEGLKAFAEKRRPQFDGR